MPAAANLLVELVGLEIGILASELEKLAVYAGESKRIERADVARMVGAGRVETVWKAARRRHDSARRGSRWNCSTTCWRPANSP